MNQVEIDRIQQEWIEHHVIAQCLHVGCGRRYIPGAVNIDPNPDRADVCDEAWDVHELPVADCTFESVVSNHVLQALRDPVLALREMTRVLKPGGVMAHVIPDHRYAPLKRDKRYPFQYMHSEWKGPEEFLPVIEQVDGLKLSECSSFTEFDWSFKVVAIKRYPSVILDCPIQIPQSLLQSGDGPAIDEYIGRTRTEAWLRERY